MIKHITVYKESGRFGGWPANCGIWSWGDEIVVGFISGYFKKSKRDHAIDWSRPQYEWQARSLNGGKTWAIEKPKVLISSNQGGKQPVEYSGAIPFTHPNFALTCRRSGNGAGASSWFYYSTDRCRNWNGPFKLPMFGQKGIAARTDYLVLDKHKLSLFLTATKLDGCEGRPFCACTTNGGKSWEFVSWIGAEPKGYSIMPSSIRISTTHLLVAVRCGENDHSWIEIFSSDDNGKTWYFFNKPVLKGENPPSMIMLKDGHLCITYGYRYKPYGIHAKLSSDNGRTWGKEIILRDGGGNWDLGYPRTIQRADGKIVTVYYFNDHEDKERYIAATIWDPEKLISTSLT